MHTMLQTSNIEMIFTLLWLFHFGLCDSMNGVNVLFLFYHQQFPPGYIIIVTVAFADSSAEQ